LPRLGTDEVAVADDDEPDDHHTAPVYLRPMLSHAQWHTISQSRASIGTAQDFAGGGPANGSECFTTGLKMNKSVSFAKVESILGGERRYHCLWSRLCVARGRYEFFALWVSVCTLKHSLEWN